MGQRIIATVAGVKSFWRCGVQFTSKGTEFDAADFTDDQWKRLMEEKMLKIEAASGSDPAPEEDQEDKTAALASVADVVEAIRSLLPEDYQKDGKPKVSAIKAILSDKDGAVTAALRDEVFEAMVEGGFAPPKTN